MKNAYLVIIEFRNYDVSDYYTEIEVCKDKATQSKLLKDTIESTLIDYEIDLDSNLEEHKYIYDISSERLSFNQDDVVVIDVYGVTRKIR